MFHYSCRGLRPTGRWVELESPWRNGDAAIMSYRVCPRRGRRETVRIIRAIHLQMHSVLRAVRRTLWKHVRLVFRRASHALLLPGSRKLYALWSLVPNQPQVSSSCFPSPLNMPGWCCREHVEKAKRLS